MSLTAKKRQAQREKAQDAKKQAARKKQAAIKAPLTELQKLALKAKVALETEQKAAAQACLKEILEVCERHNCFLHARPITLPRQDGYFVLAAEPMVSNKPQ